LALQKKSIQCPNCGAPIELQHGAVKMVVCAYCQTATAVSKEGADPTGKSAQLADFDPILRLGQHGKIKGRDFTAIGRLRFEYDDGYWDEWFCAFDGGMEYAWLHEDEGELALIQRVDLVDPIPAFESVQVGSTLMAGGHEIYVTEKNEGQIVGGEGQLALSFRPGQPVQYLDGNAGGKIAMIEYNPDGIELCVGEAIDIDELELGEG
jgi:LSD1 subclass zinc finger protein